MKQLFLGCVSLVLLGTAVQAGVVVEMEVTASDSPGSVETEMLYAQGEMARMDPRSARGGERMSVIFRDQTMWFVDHAKKVCQKIDEEGMAALSAQLGAAMKQLENLPPDQRAMMEKMMKGRMPGMGVSPPRRIEKGASERVGKYPCTVHTLYSGEEKIWEVCAADESVADELTEAMGAFQAMSRFAEKLQEAVRQGPFASMMETPYNDLDEVSGFPVRVRMFDKSGGILHESTLKAIARRDLDAPIFSIPKGYEVKDLKEEIGRGR